MGNNDLRALSLLIVVSLAVMIAALAIPIYQEGLAYRPQAEAGVLDLTGWDYAAGKTVKLDGEWEVYWGSLLEPSDLNGVDAPQRALIRLPGRWDARSVAGERLPDSGYATFRLRVLLPVEDGAFGVKTTNIPASNRLYADGRLIGSSGALSDDPQRVVHRNTPYTAFFDLNGQRDLDIVVQVASFKGYHPGTVQSIIFGSQRAIANLGENRLMVDGIAAAGFLFAALYYLVIYVQRRNNKELLYFALLAFSGVVFTITHNERLLTRLLPELGSTPQLILEHLSAIGALAFISRYIYHLLPELFNKKIIRIMDAVFIVYAILIVFTPGTFSAILVTLLPLAFAIMSINSYYMIKAIKRRTHGSVYLAISAVCLLTGMAAGALNVLWQLETQLYWPIAQPIFVMSQALYMSMSTASAFGSTQRLTARSQATDTLEQALPANTPRAPVDAFAVVQATLDMYRLLNRNPSLSLINRIKPSVYYVNADEDHLQQIIHNLVDNGVKFTACGYVAVDAKWDNGRIVLTVEDTGTGMAKERVHSMFQPVGQLEPGVSSAPDGVGLPLTKRLVELHGGDIWAESEPGAGTRMMIALPAARPCASAEWEATDALPEAAVLSEPQPLTAPSRAILQPALAVEQAIAPTASAVDGADSNTLLLVDHDYVSLRSLLQTLTSGQYRMTAVTSGEEALRLLKGGARYDLCIIGARMPGMSGYDVCRVIRQQYSLLELPILLVTADSHGNDFEAGFAAGANDLLNKPYDVVELRVRVQTLIRLRQLVRQLVQQEMAVLQAQMKPHFLFNTLNTILSLSHSDHNKARRLLTEFSLYLRYSFALNNHSGKTLLNKEVALLKAYVGIEMARFGHLLEVDIAIEQGVQYELFPSLTLQPIVENAIHHGIMKKESGGTVSISIRRIDGLEVTIKDNGVGFPVDGLHWKERKPGLKDGGLASIDRRLQSMYGSGLDIVSFPGQGTTVTLRIPDGKTSGRRHK